MRPGHFRNGAGHRRQLINVCPGGVASQDQCLGIGIGFFAALVVCDSQCGGSSSSQRERVDEPDHIPTQRTRSRPDAAKDILQLTALLQ